MTNAYKLADIVILDWYLCTLTVSNWIRDKIIDNSF